MTRAEHGWDEGGHAGLGRGRRDGQSRCAGHSQTHLGTRSLSGEQREKKSQTCCVSRSLGRGGTPGMWGGEANGQFTKTRSLHILTFEQVKTFLVEILFQ